MVVYVVITPIYWVPWMLALRLWPSAQTFCRWFTVYDWIVFALCGFRVRPSHEASGADVGPAIYVSNHQAMLDIPALILAVGTPFVFVARGNLRRVPLVAGILRSSGCVFLDRTPRGVTESMRKCEERLGAGESVLFFPEGTRSFDGRLGSFYPGAFRLALDAGVPVVPVALGGSHRLLDERSRTAHPRVLHTRVGSPIHALPGESPEALSDRTRGEMLRLLASVAPEASGVQPVAA